MLLKIENKIYTQITYKERIENPLWNEVAVREAVINAIVHNDYTTEIPPLIEIFSDRLEITSTGGLSTIKNSEEFFTGYSRPINRELMRVFKDLELVEHLGSGMERILSAYGKDSFMIDNNFMKNIFYFKEELAPQVTPQVESLLAEIKNEKSRDELMQNLNLKDRKNFLDGYLKPALELELIELTIPDKPTSSKQKYRLTAKGVDFIKNRVIK